MCAAHAQLGDFLNKGSSSSLGLDSLGSALSGQSLTASSTGNVAGVLEFCIKNNYLGGDAASSIKNALTGKLPDKAPAKDNSYLAGAKGILQGSDGRQVELGGGNSLKEKVTRQVCDQVLSQAKSLL
jgi:hypothetical protein